MKERIEQLIAELTLEEKASLCSGQDFWTTQPIERLGIPSVMVTDGPHGLRKQAGDADHLGFNESVPATCFPSGAGLASSWDRELIEEVGVALGIETQTEDVAVLLGPGVNIKRSPLCGRNFEYFSEDPYLSSQMAKHHILGVQSQGVGTSIKHFAANNQEFKRMCVDTIVDERTLREIYLASFETAIKEAEPWTVMCAYNQLNGEFCADNRNLLTEILRDEWGYEGLVVSDWGAENNRIEGIKAGMDLEMPGNGGRNDAKIIQAVKDGRLDEEDLNKVVRRVIELALKGTENAKEMTFNKEEHDAFARQVAGECMVLLKNDQELLPLKKEQKVAVIGELAKNPRYQGGGSSHINPTFLHNTWDEIKDMGDVSYSQGYELLSDDINKDLESDAIQLAKENDVVVIFAGLPERYESEGYDRKHLRIPDNQVHLIEELYKANQKVVVVLSNGGAIEMPWINSTEAILEGYLGGQASGGAVVDVLYGKVNPSGKLAETFPMQLEDNPSELFSTEANQVTYHEGIFVGYRYYDAKKMKPLFPFGHGLSYTNFEFKGIQVDRKEMKDTDEVTVKVSVENTGKVTGKEVIQLYVRDIESTLKRPIKELKEFAKVELAPGEEKEVTFVLGKRAFAYYNVAIKDWHVETGDFEILVGTSSVELPLSTTIKVESTVKVKKVYTMNSSLDDLMEHPIGATVVQQVVAGMKEAFESTGLFDAEGAKEMTSSFTLRTMLMFGGMTEEQIEQLVEQLNA
ncbi:glycoside hydrolase family 3 C-terminal domain-containing protein [Vallitalea okinawensis]|uniref:glycoside hydrolase family 3 C-terminal domain-containing protein n=1 Tax=Vallitalea okinawensis TaxID=2078660 RepID=UPI000CFD0CA1|nr:glycoside hydrolase family 3 C-terminal domain-containing protein [Vallitalea okinawensis]